MTVRSIMQLYGVSDATARRWLRGDTERLIARHLKWKYLREECARNGTTARARYARDRAGFPIDVIAGPMKRVS